MIRSFTLLLLFSFCTFLSAQEQKPILIGKKRDKALDIQFYKPFQEKETKVNVVFTPQSTAKLDIQKSNFNFKVISSDADLEIPTFIKGQLDATKRSLPLLEQADSYLLEIGELTKTQNPKNSFILKSKNVDQNANEHLKYEQYYDGIKIYGAEVILHTNKQNIDKFNGRYFPTSKLGELDTKAAVAADQLEDIVKATGKHKFQPEAKLKHAWVPDDFKQWEKELVFLPQENELILSWHIEVHPNDAEWMTYLIDAKTGAILKSHTNICSLHGCNHKDHGPKTTPASETASKSNIEAVGGDGPVTANATNLFNQNVLINTYEVGNGFFMIDGSRPMFNSISSNLPNDPVGTIWTIDAFNTAPQNSDFSYDHVSSSSNNWSKPEAVSAHFNAGKAYEYFRDSLARESVNGDGGNIVSIVNVADEDGSSMGNAFWNGSAMFYGNGDSNFFPLGRGLDVAGHEISHGVVQLTANLEYYGESGAMNESFADVFGSMIDREDWQIGEDVVKLGAFPSGALRDMQDPHNGAATGDFGGGWQPKHYNERFTGSEDNAGVHINSGIPNHAYYLFANQVGKSTAEQVFYHALTNYLTMSSKFVDLRNAVVQSASDLYGNTEVNAANSAFDQVGIGAGAGENYENDVDFNPGLDFILYADPQLSNLYIANVDGDIIANPLSQTDIRSKPSVTDDGSEIIFVGDDNRIHIINIDWTTGDVTQDVFNDNPIWRNVIISKDGNRIAAVTEEIEPVIYVYDAFENTTVPFDLYNPTFTQGVSTGDVVFADVMEFDFTGNNIMYDAANEIQSTSAGTIQYWDIGFLNVWNPSSGTFSLGEVTKLVNGLEEGESIGNPTFSKNSPYIIAFDFITQDENLIIGGNIERQDFSLIYENNQLGYPSFSNDDSRAIFDVEFDNYGEELGIIQIGDDKISGIESSFGFFFTQVATPSKWGVWFANGERILSSIEDEDLVASNINIYPNPATDELNIDMTELEMKVLAIEIINNQGQKLNTIRDFNQDRFSIDVSAYPPGMYFINFKGKENTIQKSLIVK